MDLKQKIEYCELKYNEIKKKLNENPIRSFVFGCYYQLNKYYRMELEKIHREHSLETF